MKPVKAQKWDRHPEEWYVEPSWTSRRLFDEEPFSGSIWDPCCGMGTVTNNAIAAGFKTVYASDLVERQKGAPDWTGDFLTDENTADNVVCNPPYNIIKPFTLRALKQAHVKIAVIFPTARLNAARWLRDTPLKRVWLMTPRPSMPPGEVIQRGEKPGGGKVDYAWAIFEHGFTGTPELKWLCRDGNTKVEE